MTPGLTTENSGSGADVAYGVSVKFYAYKNFRNRHDYSHYEVGENDQDVDCQAINVEKYFRTSK